MLRHIRELTGPGITLGVEKHGPEELLTPAGVLGWPTPAWLPSNYAISNWSILSARPALHTSLAEESRRFVTDKTLLLSESGIEASSSYRNPTGSPALVERLCLPSEHSL